MEECSHTLDREITKVSRYMHYLYHHHGCALPLLVLHFYLGFSIPPDFVIGYGLDYDQAGRHLDGIYQKI